MRRETLTKLLSGLLLCGTACGAPEETAQPVTVPETPGTQSAPLAAEQFGGVAEYVHRRYYTQPDVAMTSYATPALPGCNGAMVGPNILMTAAHCGADTSKAITFRTYRNGGALVNGSVQSDTETFNCSYLVQTATDTDLVLYYCYPNAGVNPGDKYGYLDLDTSAVGTGQKLYSVWTNWQGGGSVAVGDVIYSEGTVARNNLSEAECWAAASGRPNSAVQMDLWGEGGASGSVHVNSTNHRVQVGPLSTAPSGGGRWRCALGMGDFMVWAQLAATMPAGWAPSRNSALISSFGLNPDSYIGWLDEELDYRFDIQTDLERRNGETARGWYWLGFESHRRNALWDVLAPGATFDVNTRNLNLVRTSNTTGMVRTVIHRRLNLAPGSYRVSLMANTVSTSDGYNLLVALEQSGNLTVGEWLPTKAGTGFQMHTVRLTVLPGETPDLVLGTWANGDIQVTALSVVREGELMDFDTHDKRYNWRNDINGSRAQVVPDGSVSGSPNWAVRVAYDASSPAGWPVRNRQLALVGGMRYRVCLDSRAQGSSVMGVMRVVSNGTEVTRLTFWPGASYARSCSATFTALGDDNNLQLGVGSGISAYLVDNLSIELQP